MHYAMMALHIKCTLGIIQRNKSTSRRVLSLLDTLKEKYHVCGMDNLYNSVTFAKACYKHKKKVLIQGTCRRSGRGLPPKVVQLDGNGKKAQQEV